MKPVERPEAEALDGTQRRFFETAEAAYHSAVQRTGELVRCFEIAGTRIRVRFAGDAVLSIIGPGLANPVDDFDGAGPACEINVWDTASTGAGLPPPPRTLEDLTGRGPIWGFHSSRYRSSYQWGEGSVSLMDRETKRAFYWAPSANQLPVWVMGAPLRSILHWWMRENGMHLVHAAAVGYGGRGVLIPGRGGSGKSSTALACLNSGLEYISDDYLAVSMDPEPRVHRLFNTAKLDPAQLERFPELARRSRTVFEDGFDKAVLYLDGYRDQLRDSLPLTEVLTPHISGQGSTRFAEVTPQEIEAALASETIAHLPHAGADTTAFLERISLEVPSARIELGTDRREIVDRIRQRLSEPTPTRQKRSSDAHRRPFVSVVVHLQDDDAEELETIARNISEQNYHRVELLAAVDASRGNLERCAVPLVRELGLSIVVLPFNEATLQPAVWNRGVRESFGELLLFLERGDRLPDGALNAWTADAAASPETAVLRAASSGKQEITGAMVRKRLFREYGLLNTNSLTAAEDWLERVAQAGEQTHQVSPLVLRDAARRSDIHRLRWMKAQLDRQRTAGLATSDRRS